MKSCRNTLIAVMLRLGVGFVIVGVIVLGMAFFGNTPQTAEDFTGSSVNVLEMIFIFATMFAGSPLMAAIILLVGGLIMVILALLMDTFNGPQPDQRR